MSRKKIEVVELNKKEEKIILEEKQSRWSLFWKKYGKLIYLITLILSLTILLVSLFITISNLNTSEKPFIKEVSIDSDLSDSIIAINPGASLTDQDAQDKFNSIYKLNGEILLVKTIETSHYTLKFYSDYTALKIMKNSNFITKISSINNERYGIDEDGVINTKATILDITKTDTKKYSWGTVIYYSDGSAEIIDSEIDIYVRNTKDIHEAYISNNKVSYLKETKEIGNVTLNYYHDGTIQVIKNKKIYLVRNEEDIKILEDNITFTNENEATIYKTEKLADGKTIDYYTDGGAIINDGTKTLSVRKSNSIIIKDNKIFEIVDNIYVEISHVAVKGNITYYTNGSAVVNDYNGKTIYVEENSSIKHKNNKITEIKGYYEELTEKREVDGDVVLKFQTVAVVDTDEYIAIVPKDNIIYDKNGAIKEILENKIQDGTEPIILTNNTNETITYRLVIEQSKRTNLDVQYIRYQLSVGNTYIEPQTLSSRIWPIDDYYEELNANGTNYILLEKTLEAHATDEIKLMLWTDYDTIPNSMQDKYFYGTLKIYAYQKLEGNI